MIVAAVKADAARDEVRAQDKREKAAARQARKRERDRHAESRVTDVTARDQRDETPALDKRNPQTPKKINPTPAVIAPTREEPDLDPVATADWKLFAAHVALSALVHELAARRWKGFPPPAHVTATQWRGFLDYRRSIRKTLTPRAYDLLLGKLAKHADDEWPPGRIIDTIVDRGWTSFDKAWLIRISEQQNGNRPNHGRQGRPADTHPGGRDCAAADIVFGSVESG